MYALFVELVLAEFGTGLNGSWAFVLRDTIFTLIHCAHSAHIDSECVVRFSLKDCHCKLEPGQLLKVGSKVTIFV